MSNDLKSAENFCFFFVFSSTDTTDITAVAQFWLFFFLLQRSKRRRIRLVAKKSRKRSTRTTIRLTRTIPGMTAGMAKSSSECRTRAKTGICRLSRANKTSTDCSRWSSGPGIGWKSDGHSDRWVLAAYGNWASGIWRPTLVVSRPRYFGGWYTTRAQLYILLCD